MKKTVFAVFVLVVGLTLAGCSNSGRNASGSHDRSNSLDVEFEDFLVERCIREALGKSWDEDVTEKELSTLKELTISWKKDVTLGLNVIDFHHEYIGYVNLADLKYLKGLEDLKLDFVGQFTAFENMDAIADCRQLKSLTMPLPLQEYSVSSGYIGKGYSYLRDIFSQLPKLETVDFGVSVPESLQELLQPVESERKIIFAESDNSFINEMYYPMHTHIQLIEEEEDILVLSSDELMQEELEEDEYEKYKGVAESVEDVFIYVNAGEVFDCETLTDFRNIKTLVICDRSSSIKGSEPQMMHLEALSALPNLCSLSLYHVQVDFEGCEFPNLRELYLTSCEVKESFGLLKLPRLRELSLIYNNRNEGGIYVPGSDIWTNMPNLHYFQGSVFSEDSEGLTDILAEMKETAKLETLVLEFIGLDEKELVSDMLAQITEDMVLKTLFLDSNKCNIDLEQIKCNDSLENFACTSEAGHLAEFISTHPNLSAVAVSSFSEMSEWSDADDGVAYYNNVIKAAVKNSNLSMLAVFDRLGDISPEIYTQAESFKMLVNTHMMSLYEAGIYDGRVQLGAFHWDMDVETYYNDQYGKYSDFFR